MLSRKRRRRAPTQGLRRPVAAVYAPAIFMIALTVSLLGPWLLGWSWMQAIYKARAGAAGFIAPCALVISTPVTIVSGLATAANRGILVRAASTSKRRASSRRSRWTRPARSPGQTAAGGLEPSSVWKAPRRRRPSIAVVLASHSDHPVSRDRCRPAANGVGARDFGHWPGAVCRPTSVA